MDTSASAAERGEGTLGKDVQVSIGSQLRKQYQKIVEEGVPDRFLELLQRYDKKLQAGPGDASLAGGSEDDSNGSGDAQS
jgi:hypothetical protein